MAQLSKPGKQSKGREVKSEPLKCPLAEETGCTKILKFKRHSKAHVDNIHGGKAYPCPMAKENGCKKTFRTVSNANRHADSIHRGVTCPCPMAEETRCTKTFRSEQGANLHADSMHREMTHPCPMADATSCTKIFRFKQQAKDHADSIHCGKIYLCQDCQQKYKSKKSLSQHRVKAHGGGIPCPRAEEFNCNRHFPDRTVAKEHLDYNHLGITYPCPLKDELGCNARFSTKKFAQLHVDTHSEPTIPCPNAKDCSCKKKFYTLTGARNHAITKHKGIRHPCPMAAEFNCDSVYTTKTNASQHALVHALGSIPCPTFDRTNCSKRFLSITGAKRHVESAHMKRVKCPGYEGKRCNKTFTTRVGARAHAKRVRMEKWMCTVPMCRHAVTRQTISDAKIAKHITQHKEFGHVGGLDIYPQPIKVHNDSTPWEGVENRLDPEDDIGEDEDKNGGTANEDEELNEVDDLDSLYPTTEDKDDEYDYTDKDEDPTSSDSFLSDIKMMENTAAREKLTKERNEVIQRQHPDIQPGCQNLGLHCLGPGAVVDNMMVTKICHRDTIIGLDTARLRWEAAHGKLVLVGRCLSCYTEYRFNQFIESLGLAGANGQIVCSQDTCVKPTWYGTRLCQVHIWSAKPSNCFENRDDISILQDLLQKAVSHQWTVSPKVQKAMRIYDKILAGKMPPGMLRFLDLEYTPQSGRIHEVGMCDTMGNATIDCSTKLSSAELKRTSSSNVKYFGNMISTLHLEDIAGHQHSQASMDAHQIATQLREEGISPETTVVVWAKNWSDLRYLKKWLEAEGYSGIFPPESHCVTIVHPFHDNLGKLPNGRKFPASLPVLSPLLYGTSHELYSRNHHALIDTLQLRLMFQALKQLCLPLLDREQHWQIPNDAGIRQKKLVDYWPKLSNDDIDDPKEDITVV